MTSPETAARQITKQNFIRLGITAFKEHELREIVAVFCRLPGIAPQQPPAETTMTDDQVKHMVDRFLGWRLPENFSPDAGISFKPTFNDHMPHPMKHEPIGTNLFDATQADAMVRHMLEGLQHPPAGNAAARETIARALCALHHGPNVDWPIGVDKLGYHQEPYVKHIPSWEWFHGADADAVLAVLQEPSGCPYAVTSTMQNSVVKTDGGAS